MSAEGCATAVRGGSRAQCIVRVGAKKRTMATIGASMRCGFVRLREPCRSPSTRFPGLHVIKAHPLACLCAHLVGPWILRRNLPPLRDPPSPATNTQCSTFLLSAPSAPSCSAPSLVALPRSRILLPPPFHLRARLRMQTTLGDAPRPCFVSVR